MYILVHCIVLEVVYGLQSISPSSILFSYTYTVHACVLFSLNISSCPSYHLVHVNAVCVFKYIPYLRIHSGVMIESWYM